jgi:hypothetical protein
LAELVVIKPEHPFSSRELLLRILALTVLPAAVTGAIVYVVKD